MPRIVGFDLDLTLIDARPGMVRVFAMLNEEFDADLDGEYFAARLGPPMADLLRTYGVAEPMIEPLYRRYRELYPSVVIEATKPMPGAEEALQAVRDQGGRVLVITGKYEPNAALHIKALGWEVDHLSGDVFAAAKGKILSAEGASMYVGDHVGDIVAAKTAGVLSVAVATGPYDADALAEAGADVVLGDLTEFPAWFSASGAAAP